MVLIYNKVCILDKMVVAIKNAQIYNGFEHFLLIIPCEEKVQKS